MLPILRPATSSPAILKGVFDIAQNLPFLDMVDEYQKEKAAIVRSYVGLRRFYRQKTASQKYLFEGCSSLPMLAPLKKAVKRLDAKYWQSLMEQSRLSNVMSAVSKKEWENDINTLAVPAFTLENLVASMQNIFSLIPHYLKERVITAFSGLSNSHVTNSGFGFGHKMIVEEVFSAITSQIRHPSACSTKVGVLDEIRKLVIFFSSFDPAVLEKHENISSGSFVDYAIAELNRTGRSKFYIDNDLIVVQVYKKGTIHFGIHPEIAERMNAFIATIMGLAIGNASRTKTAYYYTPRPATSYDRKFISKQAIDALRCFRGSTFHLRRDSIKEFNAHPFLQDKHNLLIKEWKGVSSNTQKEAEDVLRALGLEPMYFESVGGPTVCVLKNSHKMSRWSFDSLLSKILNEGLDCKVSYQQYYTNEAFSKVVFDTFMEYRTLGELQAMELLEPSAGIGGLSSLLPAANTTVVELSEINCEILKTQDYKEVICDDFLLYASHCQKKFDGILMNPPFVDMQAYGHVMTASRLLAPTGTLVAVVPDSLRTAFSKGIDNSRFILEVSRTYTKAFDDANVNVCLVTLTCK